MIVLEPVQAAVWNCLQNFMYADAVFIAERLHAELKTEESAHTLAVAYFNNGSIHQAYDTLHRSSLTRPLNKFLFARCCCVMNKRQEAETTLLGHHVRKPAAECIESLVAEYEDIACFVFVMLGEIYLKTERKKLAVRALNRALTLNPCLFSAYKLLCDAGEGPNPKEVFKFETVDALNLTMGASCWTNFAHAKVTLNQSIPVHPHHHFSHVFPEEHSTPFPTTTPVVDIGKPWQPPAPCKAKIDGGRLSPTGNLNGKRQLELQTPAGNGKRPAFGALFVGDASDNSIVMNSSFLELAPKPVSHPIAAAAQSSTALNIKDLQPAPSVNQAPLKSTPLVVSQTNNVSAEQSQDGEVRPIVPDVQPPLKRSARLQPATAVTKENKGTAKGRNLSRPSSTNAGGNGGGLSKRPRNTRGGGNGRTARGLLPVDSENENKTQGGPSVSETSNNQALSSPPPTATPVAVENTKNLEKTAAAIEEERPGVFELAAQAQKQSAAGLMKLFQDLGSAYRNLCQYDCVEGLKALQSLSNQQLKTGWVMCLKARLYFELGMFDEAVKVFEQVREMEPMRLEGLEYYSSALWQLQREVDLSALAGSLMDINHHHWVPWMSLANCFSASQEHNTAIKYFQRALQLNHESSYVYCLLAQEFFIVDDIENSQAAFRNALYVNQNDYRAWMGLGMVSFKQEMFKLAKVSYRKALRLNPMSTMVMCQLGLCLVKMKETSDAIETFKRALEVNPRNPLCKYHLASTLVLAYQFEAAKDLLLELTEETPREAQVFFLLGKIFKKLGKENLSLMYISWAVDLDPKVGKAPWKDRAASGVTADLDNGADHPADQSLGGTTAPSVDVMSAQAAEGEVFNSAAMANEGENADLMLHSGFEGEADESGDEDGAGDELATSPVADASYVAGSSA